MNVFSLLKAGGVTVVILMSCSVLSWAIVMERLFYYWRRAGIKRADFMSMISGDIKKGNMDGALALSRRTQTPFAQVAGAGLASYGQDKKNISNAMNREIAIQTGELERNTGITGSIGSVSVYIGLFGTVLGIIKAFHDISTQGSGGLNVVVNGVSEALVCTAVGLAVAIPAVLAYNYFVKRTDRFVVDMELCASEVLDLLSGTQR